MEDELAMPYDEFLAHEWADPRIRTWAGPAHRGQGLALPANWHALRGAAAAGVARAVAGDDDADTPMVAINDRLGYRPFVGPPQAQRPVVCEPDAATSSAEGRGGRGREPRPS